MNKRLGKLLRPSVGQYLFVLIAFAVLCLFGKGFASAGGEIIEELIDELDLDDLLYYLM